MSGFISSYTQPQRILQGLSHLHVGVSKMELFLITTSVVTAK